MAFDVLLHIAPAQQPYHVPTMSKSSGIRAGDSIIFSCKANVGKPLGSIRWWKYGNAVDDAEELFATQTEFSPTIDPWICKYNMTSFVTVTFIEEDDQVIIRCSVDQALVTSPTGLPQDKPYQETQRINVHRESIWILLTAFEVFFFAVLCWIQASHYWSWFEKG